MNTVTIGLCAKDIASIQNETIDSIMRQDFPLAEMELIIVSGRPDLADNKTVGAFSNAKLKVRVYYDYGSGLATARQIVVEKAKGRYIVWVDCDVTLSKSFVRRQVEFMDNNADVGVSIGQYDNIELEGEFVANIVSLFMSLLKVVYFGATIARVDAIKDVGGFDRRIKGASEDVDIVLRLVSMNWRITTNLDAKFFHRQRETFREVFRRGVWYGHGGHFLNHKYEALTRIPYRLPPVFLMWGLKLSIKAYKKYHDRKSFLIPLVTLLSSLGWLVGFTCAHKTGYGHSISVHEKSKAETRAASERIATMLGKV